MLSEKEKRAFVKALELMGTKFGVDVISNFNMDCLDYEEMTVHKALDAAIIIAKDLAIEKEIKELGNKEEALVSTEIALFTKDKSAKGNVWHKYDYDFTSPDEAFDMRDDLIKHSFLTTDEVNVCIVVRTQKEVSE